MGRQTKKHMQPGMHMTCNEAHAVVRLGLWLLVLKNYRNHSQRKLTRQTRERGAIKK